MDLTRFYWVFTKFLPGFTTFHWVFHVWSWLCCVKLFFKRYLWILPSFTLIYWVLPNWTAIDRQTASTSALDRFPTSANDYLVFICGFKWRSSVERFNFLSRAARFLFSDRFRSTDADWPRRFSRPLIGPLASPNTIPIWKSITKSTRSTNFVGKSTTPTTTRKKREKNQISSALL